MRDKRTDAQLAFDMVKHGWAFCDADMLRTRINHIAQFVAKLAPNDPRRAEFEQMKTTLADMGG